MKALEAVSKLKEQLGVISDEQNKAEEEQMSRNILRSVQKALKEAILVLPREEYDWFDVFEKNNPKLGNKAISNEQSFFEKSDALYLSKDGSKREKETAQKKFFEFAGPLSSVRIQPGSSLVEAGKTKSFRAIGLDYRRRQVEENLVFNWCLIEGAGILDKQEGEIVSFKAPQEPGLAKIKVAARQGKIVCEGEVVVTVVDVLIKPVGSSSELSKGLPGYTLESAPGKLWRSYYDLKRNLIIINSGHRDFIYASKQKIRKLRYICRLFAKELICQNFVGATSDQLLERMVELSLYTEDNLK